MQRLLTVLLLTVSVVAAQEFRGTLEGTVFDPHQAVVPAAQLTLVNVETSVERQAVSARDGHYVFDFVAPGKYSLSTKAAGFKIDKHDGIPVNIGETVRIDVNLTLGTASESVEVAANAVAVAADSSSLGAVLRQDVVEAFPIKGHASLTLFQLTPGIVNPPIPDDNTAVSQTNTVNFVVNGSPVGKSEIAIDGVSEVVDVNRGNGEYSPSFIPPPDSVAEFKLLSGTLPAEYGRSAGSIMFLVTKSGTNDVHGTVYNNLRNSALDANLFFNNVAGLKLPANHEDNFGLTVGGPVWLPKVYDGRNKTFFFVSYDAMRLQQVFGYVDNVPTALMRTGNFSQVPTPIYDPYSVQAINGAPTRIPFPNNVIPVQEQDPVGKNLMQYWPLPNLAPTTGNAWVNDFSMSNPEAQTWDFVQIKGDHAISSKQQVSARVNFGPGAVGLPYYWNGVATPGRYNNPRGNQGASLSDTYIFSPSIAVTLRLGFARGGNSTIPYSKGFDISTLGFASSFVNAVTQGKTFPTVSFNDGTIGLGQTGFASQPGQSVSTEDAVMIAHGRHVFKAGVDIRNLRGSNFVNTAPDGTFSFSSNQTGGPNAATPSGGFALASMLLGFGSSGSITTAPAVSWQEIYYGFYFQDDFRASSKLTINMGLRWEYQVPRTESFNRSVVGFAYNTPTGIQEPGYSLNGGLIYAGVNGAPRSRYNPDWHNYSPRLGFAYSLNSKTVIRGGYSLMFMPNANPLILTGYSVSSPWVTSLDGGITVANKLSNPLPGGALPVTGNRSGLLTNVGQGISFTDPSDMPPAFHNWHFGVQRALPSAGLLTVAYVGSRAIHLPSLSSVNIDQVPAQDFALGSALTQTVPNPFYGLFTAGSFTGATIQEAQLLRPYPQFSPVTRVMPGYGNSHYEAVEVAYEKAMGLGLAGLASFAWSKNLSDIFNSGNSPQNFYNRSTEQGLADFDAPRRFSLAMNWNIPVGRGREFFHNLSKPLDSVLGGWQVSTSMIFQEGLPAAFSVTGGTYFSDAIRPTVVGDPSQGVTGSIGSRLTDYFNTAAFARPANFTMGNVAPRIGSVRSPGTDNVDLALGKTFPIHERLKAELRAEAYNSLNHPVFAAPSFTLGSSSFGIIGSQQNNNRQVEIGLKLRF
jgi:Carboxypeptidase regulatory-like domain/TonB dependent receptor